MSRKVEKIDATARGQAAFDRARSIFVAEFERLIEGQRRLIAELENEPARIVNRLVEEKKRQMARDNRVARLEARLVKLAAGTDRAAMQNVSDELASARVRVVRGAARLAELKFCKGKIPGIEKREQAARQTLADLEQRLADGPGLDALAEPARGRAIREAGEDIEAAANAIRRNKARRLPADRDRPTAEQIARRGIAGTTREGAFRLAVDLPDAILRMRRAGFPFEEGELEAAARYREDYRFGCERAKMVGSYEVGVQGGAGEQDIKESKLDAFERYRAAAAALLPATRTVLDAVVIHDCDLASAGGLANRYGGEKARRTANGTLLALALATLNHHYSRH